MGTVIAAVITILLPVIMISFGTVNRDKRDVSIRNIAKELGMEEVVGEIDQKRKERIERHVNSQGVLSIVRWFNAAAMALTVAGFTVSLIPLWQSVKDGDIELKYISYGLTGVGFLLSLIGLAIALINFRKTRRKLKRLKVSLRNAIIANRPER